jgi:hypothetical protein
MGSIVSSRPSDEGHTTKWAMGMLRHRPVNMTPSYQNYILPKPKGGGRKCGETLMTTSSSSSPPFSYFSSSLPQPPPSYSSSLGYLNIFHILIIQKCSIVLITFIMYSTHYHVHTHQNKLSGL